MTVEDPIEYYIDGIGQTQVNTKVEMTFARGLRAILRQDPDVVLVGEIRDLETAQIAVQASADRTPGALDAAYQYRRGRAHPTARHGHRAVPALLEPGGRAGAAPGAGTQSGDPPDLQAGEYERRLLGLTPDEPPPTLYRPGRDARRRLPRTHRHLRAHRDRRYTAHHDPRWRRRARARRYARKFTPSIRDDGLARVLKGETTLEEVLRVTRED